MAKSLSNDKNVKPQRSRLYLFSLSLCLILILLITTFFIYKAVNPPPQDRLNEYSGAQKVAAEKAVNLSKGPTIVEARVVVTDIKNTSLEGICNDEFTLSNVSGTELMARYEVTLAKSNVIFYETYTVYICQY